MKTKNTEYTLKSVTEKEEFEQIERAIKTNEESTKRLLQQKKFKKFNTLKHKPQTSHKEKNLKENEKGPQSRSQGNKQKTGRDQFRNVTSRNTSTNDLSNEQPTPIEKKSNFWTPTRENKHGLNHQQEATPKLTTLKTNKQKNKKLKNSRKK